MVVIKVNGGMKAYVKQLFRRLAAAWLVCLGLWVVAGPQQASAANGVPLRLYVQESNQYLYTTLLTPVGIDALQAGLPQVGLRFDGQPVVVQSSVVSGGMWHVTVSSAIVLHAGHSVLQVYDVSNPIPLFDIELPMHLVPRNPANLSPDCDVAAAVLSGSTQDCRASYQDSEVIELPDEPPQSADPSPTDTKSVRALPPSPTAIQASTPTQTSAATMPISGSAAYSVPTVLSQVTMSDVSSQETTFSKQFELTPEASVGLITAGIAVAGAGAIVVNKLGINKPKP